MGEHEGGGNEGEEGATGQATVPDESWADLSVHGFWKWGTSDLFDMCIFNLDADSYLRQTSAKALATAEKKKKDKYLQPGLERRRCSLLWCTPWMEFPERKLWLYIII